MYLFRVTIRRAGTNLGLWDMTPDSGDTSDSSQMMSLFVRPIRALIQSTTHATSRSFGGYLHGYHRTLIAETDSVDKGLEGWWRWMETAGRRHGVDVIPTRCC